MDHTKYALPPLTNPIKTHVCISVQAANCLLPNVKSLAAIVKFDDKLHCSVMRIHLPVRNTTIIVQYTLQTANDITYITYYILGNLIHKVLAHNQPLHLSHLLTPYTPARSLRSQDKHLLAVPTVSTVTGKCSLSYAAPSTWNEIPVKSHNSPSLVPFKKHLKTNITFPYCHHTIPP